MKAGFHRGSLSARILQAQDAERRRISRELHDSVGQTLTAATMALGRAIRSSKTAKEDLQECRRLVEAAQCQVRSVSYLLHPPLLDLVGLGPAIRAYVEGLDKRSDISLHVEIPENLPRLSPEKETAAFRIVQECLMNVHRYSGASNAWVRVILDSHAFRVEVQDDGKGIAAAHLPAAGPSELSVGVGIAGMRERVGELRGSLEIQTSDAGTHVIATIPTGNEGRQSSTLPLPELRPVQKNDGHIFGSRKRIVIVEDFEIMRRGIRVLVENEPDLEVCGEAVTVAEAVETIRELKPDAVILDLRLPDGPGWEVLRSIRKFEFWTKVLIFTAHNFSELANAARATGCEGFLTKSRASTDLITALRTVLSGRTFYSSESAAGHTAHACVGFSSIQSRN
jgi:CheY-like chemotaxis protein